MAKNKPLAPYLILWRIQQSHNPIDNDWTIYDSFLSLAQRNEVFNKLKMQACSIIEYKRDTNHNSPVINPNISYEQANSTNRP